MATLTMLCDRGKMLSDFPIFSLRPVVLVAAALTISASQAADDSCYVRANTEQIVERIKLERAPDALSCAPEGLLIACEYRFGSVFLSAQRDGNDTVAILILKGGRNNSESSSEFFTLASTMLDAIVSFDLHVKPADLQHRIRRQLNTQGDVLVAADVENCLFAYSSEGERLFLGMIARSLR